MSLCGEAEMTVERLVQQFSIERTDIFIAAERSYNTAGIEEAGSAIPKLAHQPRRILTTRHWQDG
jgi:hypothetical protein